MTKEYILATSGFLFKKNSYFTDFTEADSMYNNILNRNLVSSSYKEIVDYYINNEVYRSNAVNLAYTKYITDPIFENYMALVDITIDILKDIDFVTFYKLQASNKHLSPMAFNICKDLYDGVFIEKYKDYNILPFNLRFMVDNGLTASVILSRLNGLNADMSSNGVTSNRHWEHILQHIVPNKSAMLTLYKFIFADYY